MSGYFFYDSSIIFLNYFRVESFPSKAEFLYFRRVFFNISDSNKLKDNEAIEKRCFYSVIVIILIQIILEH